MRTLVLSDLHLGARHGADVLRRPVARERLVAALEGIDRLVLLGDVLELRHGPIREALAVALPVIEEVGAAMAGGEVRIVPGNHDYAIAERWLGVAPALGLDQSVAPAEASPLAAVLADALAPARVQIAYPGVWLRDDVYATHGHYSDVHSTTPTFERLGAGLMTRLAGAPPAHGARPDDYEAILAPIYAWIHAAAQRASTRRPAAGARRAVGPWEVHSASRGRPLRQRPLAAAFPLAVAVVNRAGLGPVRAEVSGPALRRGGLSGMHEALDRLGVGAAHVIFGHTHRTGPLPRDDAAEWHRPGRALTNCGSWVFERHFMGDLGSAGPYWPGGAIELGDHGPPLLRRLLDDVPADELRAPVRA